MRKSQEKSKKVEGNKKEANKKEHCLSASRVFDSAQYEQGGSDRAEYGTRLLKTLEEQIAEKGMNSTLFKWCRQFYILYPQIGATVSHQLGLPDFGKSATR